MMLAWLLILCGSLVSDAAGQPSPRQEDRIQVLFLGDDGHHEPALRVRQILPYMAAQGIHVVYTDNPEDLNPERLSRYDVLMLYGNTPTITKEQEQALLNFVEEGGGLVPIHSASSMFRNSDAYASLVGGAFKSHGVGTFGVNILQADHPAIQGVPDFESWDETYVHMKHNPDKLVLSVRAEGDHEEPWTWVRTHGEGRVFYTAWGHDERTWSNPGFHKLLEQGARWAAGDWALNADGAPPPLEYTEGELPYYPPGVGWGVTGDPITSLQQPLDPETSLEQAFVEPGFRMELFAAEPDVINPIDLTWDERGRLWVVETVDYPNEFKPGRQGLDRIKILEDTDGDGRADKATIFADSLNIPTSLVLVNGGVLVTQVPDMLYLKDTDGDDRADMKEVLFTGWGPYDTHAGPSNLRYGLDNQIWGVVGYSGFDGLFGGDSLQFSQAIYRFAPDGSWMEHMAGTNNNTWGLAFSEEGIVFASTANRNPSSYMAIPTRYYDQVRGWEQDRLGSIADNSLIYPVTDHVRQVDQHGRYTAGSGYELYTARSFPKEYWNRVAFIGGPTGHLLGKFVHVPEGAGFEARNDQNMVASRDEWFAPIQAKVGPDGALWMIDWYDLIIQHNPTPPEYETGEGNAYETELRDEQHSRIYRLVYEEAPEEEPLTLADATPQELVSALQDDNMFWRLTAQRLLVERGEADVLPQLYDLVRDEHVDEIGLNVAAIHALWTMHGLGALDGSNEQALAVATDALHHPSAGVRRAALMVLPRTAGTLDAIMQAGLLPDPTVPENMVYTMPTSEMDAADAQVRLAALLAVAEVPTSDKAGTVVAELVVVPENATDPWISDAAMVAGAQHPISFLQAVLPKEIPLESDTTYAKNLSRVVRSVAAHYAAGEPSKTLMATIAAVEEADTLVANAFLKGLAAGWPEGEAPALSASDQSKLKALRTALPPEQAEHLQTLVRRWGQPDFFAQNR